MKTGVKMRHNGLTLAAVLRHNGGYILRAQTAIPGIVGQNVYRWPRTALAHAATRRHQNLRRLVCLKCCQHL